MPSAKSQLGASPSGSTELASALDRALAFHQAGRLSEAEGMYRQILTDQPNHFDALYLLGFIHHQRGNHADAVRHIDAALAINPQALAIKPNYADAFFTRGNALFRLRQFREAVASYDQALALKPDSAEVIAALPFTS